MVLRVLGALGLRSVQLVRELLTDPEILEYLEDHCYLRDPEVQAARLDPVVLGYH